MPLFPTRGPTQGSPLIDDAKLADMERKHRLGVTIERPSVDPLMSVEPPAASDPLAEAWAFLEAPSVVPKTHNNYTPEPQKGAMRAITDLFSGRQAAEDLTKTGHPYLGTATDFASAILHPTGQIVSGIRQTLAPEADESRMGGALNALLALPMMSPFKAARRADEAARALAGAEEMAGSKIARPFGPSRWEGAEEFSPNFQIADDLPLNLPHGPEPASPGMFEGRRSIPLSQADLDRGAKAGLGTSEDAWSALKRLVNRSEKPAEVAKSEPMQTLAMEDFARGWRPNAADEALEPLMRARINRKFPSGPSQIAQERAFERFGKRYRSE